jgi:hypothetical protein
MKPMTARIRLCLGVLALLFHGVAWASEVIVLTDANFDSLVRGRGGIWMIDIYSPGWASSYLLPGLHMQSMEWTSSASLT